MAGKEDCPKFKQEKGASRGRMRVNQFTSILALANWQKRDTDLEEEKGNITIRFNSCHSAH